MKAICFTFDRNMPIKWNMFCIHILNVGQIILLFFYIPWNNFQPEHLIQQYGTDKIKLLKTDSAVKPTIRTLLSVVDKNEFVWWAQDDKYILDFKNKQIIKDLYQYDDLDIGGFMFTKNADSEKLFPNVNKDFGGYNLIQKSFAHQIFQPQFFKKEILEKLYLDKRLRALSASKTSASYA